MTYILGRKLITDWKPLEDILEAIKKDPQTEAQFEIRFPGMLTAVFNGCRYLDQKRLLARTVTYLNFRVQVWAQEGFDADPSMPVRVIPAGIEVDPNWEWSENPAFQR